jgi:hypothetical protein
MARSAAARLSAAGGVHNVAFAGEPDVATANAVEHELTAVEATDATGSSSISPAWTASPAPAYTSSSAPMRAATPAVAG